MNAAQSLDAIALSDDPIALRGTRREASILAGEGLVLGFGKHVVVDSASVQLAPGRVTALVGPNGSGKTTLLRALARLHPIQAGEVTLSPGDRPGPDGLRSAKALSAREFAREVTLFAQTRQAPSGLSVREVVTFGRHPYRRRFAGLTADDRAAIDAALEATGVTDMAERAAGDLSGGELQRVWLAACLAQDTGVVLLDEPTNHLDLRYQVETLDLIRDLADVHGVAVGVVLHDLDHAAQIADELVLMKSGHIVAAGPPLHVLSAETISSAYDLRVDVSLDPRTNRLRIDPIGRHATHPR